MTRRNERPATSPASDHTALKRSAPTATEAGTRKSTASSEIGRTRALARASLRLSGNAATPLTRAGDAAS